MLASAPTYTVGFPTRPGFARFAGGSTPVFGARVYVFQRQRILNKIADGYTLFGTQLTPQLVYYPAPALRLEAGVFLWKDFGNPVLQQVRPTYRATWTRGTNQFVFGNLRAHLHHAYIEPLLEGIKKCGATRLSGCRQGWPHSGRGLSDRDCPTLFHALQFHPPAAIRRPTYGICRAFPCQGKYFPSLSRSARPKRQP